QRLVRGRARVDSHDRVLGGAPEAPGAHRGVVRARRGRRVSRTVRRLVVVLAAMSLIGSALSFLTGCGGSSSSSATSTTAVNPTDRAQAAAEHFLDRYVDSDGRVVRRDQGGDTVGEGQAYGMLMAAAIGDRRRFNSIWDWTQRNLQRPDGLISF